MIRILIILIKAWLKIWRRLLRIIFTLLVKMNASKVGQNLYVNGFSIVTRYTCLGENVNFNGMKIFGNGIVEIGNNFHSGTECQMITQFHNFDNGNAIPYDDTYIIKNIKIEDNVWLGNRVMILGGVTLGEGAIVQAGSVVVKSIPKFAIAGGHPCEVFKFRDKNHYNSLKDLQKYH